MNTEIERVKNDLETMQKALGTAPAFGREWVRWIRRDNGLYLWWCLPGLILIAGAMGTFDNTQRHFGLLPNQWIGLLTAAAILGIGWLSSWRTTRNDGRPDGLVREYRRVNARSLWFLPAVACYFIWGRQHAVSFESFWAGLWILCGSLLLVFAAACRLWVLLGWAIPFLGYGLCHPLVQGHHRQGTLLLGATLITGALLCPAIQAWQCRRIDALNDAH